MKHGRTIPDGRRSAGLRRVGLRALDWLLFGFAAGGVASAMPQDRALAPGLGFTRDFEREYPAGDVSAMAAHDDGSGMKLYMGGDFGSVQGHLPFISRNIIRWDGANWSNVGGGLRLVTKQPIDVTVDAMCSFQGKLYVCSGFNQYWSIAQQAWIECARVVWDGGPDLSCMPIPPTGLFQVHDLLVHDDGTGPQLYFGSRTTNGIPLRWDGSTFSHVGQVQIAPHKLVSHDLGSGPLLFTAGYVFEPIGGQDAQHFAAWDGTSWTLPVHPLPFTMTTIQPGGIHLVSVDFASGSTLFLEWSGLGIWEYRHGTWTRHLGASQFPYPIVESMIAFDDGNGPALFVVGDHLLLPGLPAGQCARVARFDGQDWTSVGRTYPIVSYDAGTTPATVFDHGEGPDLYIGGLELAGGQGTPAGLPVARYRAVHRELAAVCGGDGALIRCPCGTRGKVGHGCPNSTTIRGARLEGSGVAAADALRLRAEELPASTMALLFQGDEYAYLPVFSGDGVTCTAGTVLRIGTRQAIGGVVEYPGPGEATIGARVRAMGDPLSSGAVRYYQLWYRDPEPAFCAQGGLLNTTNGMRVVW